MPRQIILASSSPYRRQILERIGIAFTCHSPDIDETPRAGESAAGLVVRLAREKVAAVASAHPADDNLIIGCDQVADLHGEIIGKPGGFDAAVAQLRRMSGARVTLYSGIALYDAAAEAGAQWQTAVEPFVAEFRELDDDLIRRYVTREQPYDCCGGVKAEGVGIALLRRLHGDDPNALIGLPVIKLMEMLKNVGVELI